MKVLLTKLLLASCCLSFFACAKSSPITEVGNPTAGQVTKGPVSGSVVSIYVLNSDGTLGTTALAQLTTSDTGAFTIPTSIKGPIALIATGGSYKDEATGELVTIDPTDATQTFKAWIDQVQLPATVTLTPLTTMMVAQAEQTLNDGTGKSVGDSLTSAQTNIATIFGLGGIELETTQPDDLTDKSASSNLQRSETKYGLILAALSQTAVYYHIQPGHILDLVNHVVEDLSDGVLDEKNGSQRLPPMAATSQQVIDHLKTAMSAFLNGPYNASGIKSEDAASEFPTLPTPSSAFAP